jgi:hypothetical protein
MASVNENDVFLPGKTSDELAIEQQAKAAIATPVVPVHEMVPGDFVIFQTTIGQFITMCDKYSTLRTFKIAP